MKLRRKLILSGAALAACAMTLVSTTYAWYVNNPTATVGSPSGSTMNAGTSGSISVSKDGADGTWKKSLTDVEFTGTDLIPVTPSAADLSAFKDVTKEGAAVAGASGAYYTFNFWVKTDVDLGNGTSGYKVDLTYVLTNTTEDALPTQTAFVEAGGLTAGQVFAVDARNALRMAMKIDDGSYTIYDAAAAAEETPVSDGITNASTVATGKDANAYYNALNEYTTQDDEYIDVADCVYTNAVGSQADIVLTGFTAGEKHQLTFIVWLEGYDTDCFNAVAGQDFQFDYTLNLVKIS